MKHSLIVAIATTLLLGSCNSMKKTSAQTNTAATEQSLTGSWELDHVPNPSGETFGQLYMTRKPRLTFDEKAGTFNGFTGCNTINGKMEINKGAISFNEEMVMTKMACQGDGEKIFLENLKRINHYSITKNGEELTLIQGDMALMHFHKMAQ